MTWAWGWGSIPTPIAGRAKDYGMERGMDRQMENGNVVLSSVQKAFYGELEQSIKTIYKMALDILSEVSEKEEAAIEKLMAQQPALKALAPFLLVLDDVQYNLFRSRILDLSNGELRRIKDRIGSLNLVPVREDIIKVRRSS